MKKQYIPYIYAAVTIFMWSTIAVISKLLLGKFNNFQVLWMSSLLGSVMLLILNTASGIIKQLKRFRLKDYLTVLMAGLPGTLLYYIFYYAGTDILPSASQSFIINYLWPIMSVVFACIINKEKMTFRKAIAIALSFLGIAAVASKDLFVPSDVSLSVTLLGALMCILGAVSYGLFTALTNRFNYEKSLMMMISFIGTFLITTIINGVRGDLFIPTGVEILGFIWNGMFVMALASTAWAIALNMGDTVKISNLAYITPFLSLLWTVLILKEELSIFSIIGLVIIVAGIFIQLKDKK
ncbi:MAG: DMT family transporter [Clostridia bacterium]|nr:DMT family transporter [Clostridia bacterium]